MDVSEEEKRRGKTFLPPTATVIATAHNCLHEWNEFAEVPGEEGGEEGGGQCQHAFVSDPQHQTSKHRGGSEKKLEKVF